MRLILTLVIALSTIPGSLASNIQGAAPDFTLKSNNGKNLRLSEQRGQVVLLNFWATWCGPCRQEMPILDTLHQQYQKLGFTVMGINVDQQRSAAERILKDIPVSFPVLFDSGSTVSEQYQVDAMPTTVLIDRDGNMRYLHRGYQSGSEDLYETQIKTLVRE